MNTPSPSRSLTPLRRRSTHLRISRLILPSKLRLAFRACVSFLFLHLLLEVVYYLIATEKKIGVNLVFKFRSYEFMRAYPIFSKFFTGPKETESHVLAPFGTAGSLPLFWPLQKAVSSVFATVQRIRQWSVPIGCLSLVIPGRRKLFCVRVSFSGLGGSEEYWHHVISGPTSFC